MIQSNPSAITLLERIKQLQEWRETYRLAVPGSDEEYTAYLAGLDDALRILTHGSL